MPTSKTHPSATIVIFIHLNIYNLPWLHFLVLKMCNLSHNHCGENLPSIVFYCSFSVCIFITAQQCLWVIIIPVLSILFLALDVGRIPSLGCQTQSVSKVEGWISEVLVGGLCAISALPFFLSLPTRSQWWRVQSSLTPAQWKARLLELCRATRAAPVIPTAWPPDFPGVPKQKLIGWPLNWSPPPSQLHLNHSLPPPSEGKYASY